MLQSLFSPKKIAIIGASYSPEKLGHVIVQNLIKHRFRGKLFPVNPKGGKLFGKKVYQSIGLLPKGIDLAIIVIPAQFVKDALQECGKKKIKAAIIISAGFGEQGSEGRAREEEIIKLAKKYKIRVLGPNCLGIIVPRIRLNASFAQGMPEKGSVAVVSQSGAMAVGITDWALSCGLGFSALVSLGNKADINEEEIINYFAKDPSTKAIVMYLESLRTGRSLLRTIERVSRSMPVVILKPGKSEKAKHAVMSHTGALAGTHDVELAALASAGAIIVSTLQDLFTLAVLFEKKRQLRGSRVAVVTNAGGPGILMTDALVANNFFIAELSSKTKKYLASHLPEAAAIDNPVDVIGDAPASRYKIALQAVLKDPNVDAVVCVLTHQYVTETDKVARLIVNFSRRFPKKPIIATFIGGTGVESGRMILGRAHVPQFSFPDQASLAFSALRSFGEHAKMKKIFPEMLFRDSQKTKAILGSKAERIASRYISGILFSKVLQSKKDLLRAAERIGYPVVAKVVSQSHIHKTDASLVVVNITSAKVLENVINSWEKKFKFQFGKDEGYLLQAYRPGDLEVFIGAKRDPILGPYCVVGVGGVFVEAIADASIHPIPLTRGTAETLITKGILGKILASPRGKKLASRKLVNMILGVSQLMKNRHEVVACDVNPVMVSKKDAWIADIRLIVVGK